MMKIVTYRYFTVLLHILAWSIVLFFPYFISKADNQYRIGPLPGLYFTLSAMVHMVIFYTNAFLLYPRLLSKRYWWLYIISAIALIISSFWAKFYILWKWFPDDLQEARTHILFPSLLIFMISVFYCIMVERIRSEKTQKENEALQLGMELKLLRSQISPHFLFNILTNLVALARKRSDQLEPSLLMLSGLMRYMLNDANKKISLQQEVEYLESYIALQTLRFERDVHIISKIELSGEESNYQIEPMLLIPFVENAFKHGVYYEGQPFIDINLSVSEGVLIFDVKNRFDRETDTAKSESSGIGLRNVQSRLALLYPGRHDLVIRTEDCLFSIHLTLKLL